VIRAGKIAIEEHFNPPYLADEAAKYYPVASWQKLRPALQDLEGRLLSDMDACGIETCVLSLGSPGIQAILDTQRAIEVAQRTNDFLAEQVAKRPDRFQGFAALPLQDTEAAAVELTRCVKELGFKGALVNGFTQIDREDSLFYYDLPRFWPLGSLFIYIPGIRSRNAPMSRVTRGLPVRFGLLEWRRLPTRCD